VHKLVVDIMADVVNISNHVLFHSCIDYIYILDYLYMKVFILVIGYVYHFEHLFSGILLEVRWSDL
jgi:hypothetical protein